jgi:hypothetical protein
MILNKISTSTWDVIFSKTRVLNIFVVRSILIYETAMWYTLKEKKTEIVNKLTIIQNRFLRIIFETFKITVVSVLKAKTHITSMNIHLNQFQALTRYRMRVADISTIIFKTCRTIESKLQKQTNKRKKHRQTSSELKHAWAKIQLMIENNSSTQIILVSWAKYSQIYLESDKFAQLRKKEIVTFHAEVWKKKWKKY